MFNVYVRGTSFGTVRLNGNRLTALGYSVTVTVSVHSLTHIRQHQLSSYARSTAGGSQASPRRQASLRLCHHVSYQGPHTRAHPWVANPIAHTLPLQPKPSRHMLIGMYLSNFGTVTVHSSVTVHSLIIIIQRFGTLWARVYLHTCIYSLCTPPRTVWGWKHVITHTSDHNMPHRPVGVTGRCNRQRGELTHLLR
jgi:hypothetical protein